MLLLPIDIDLNALVGYFRGDGGNFFRSQRAEGFSLAPENIARVAIAFIHAIPHATVAFGFDLVNPQYLTVIETVWLPVFDSKTPPGRARRAVSNAGFYIRNCDFNPHAQISAHLGQFGDWLSGFIFHRLQIGRPDKSLGGFDPALIVAPGPTPNFFLQPRHHSIFID